MDGVRIAHNLKLLRAMPDAADYRFHQVLRYEDIYQPKIDFNRLLALAEPHDRALAEGTLDLGERRVESFGFFFISLTFPNFTNRIFNSAIRFR